MSSLGERHDGRASEAMTSMGMERRKDRTVNVEERSECGDYWRLNNFVVVEGEGERKNLYGRYSNDRFCFADNKLEGLSEKTTEGTCKGKNVAMPALTVDSSWRT